MQWRRRNFLINKDFQLRFIARILFGISIMALTVAFTAYYTTWVRIMDQFYNLPPVAAQFAPLFLSVNRTLLLLLILFLLISAMLAVFVSHTIAGPLFRFEQTLKSLLEGDLTLTIGLRRSDEFKSLMDLFNALSGKWREQVRENRLLLDEAIDAAKRQGAGKSTKGADLLSKLVKLKESWKHFRTD